MHTVGSEEIYSITALPHFAHYEIHIFLFIKAMLLSIKAQEGQMT